MIETYFTSDHHFGHKNILEYEKEARPFNSVEEMNEKLITNWNNTVSPKDNVFHLGDFAFGKHNISIADRLHGHKRLIMGNHDIYDHHLYLQYFEKIFGCLFWKSCVLTHIPVHHNNLGSRAFLNVHGHLHHNVVYNERLITEMCWKNPEGVTSVFPEPDYNYFNVSVERHNLTPVHQDIIMERMKEILE